VNDRVVVITDWKTSKFIGPEMRLQLAAYANCPTLQAKPEYGLIVQVTDEHCKPVVVMDSTQIEKAYRAFCSLKAGFDWMVKDGLCEVKGRYWYDGDSLPSVTEILSNVLAKPGLLNWYYTMGKAGQDPNKFRDAKGDQGSQVHKTIHLLLKQVPFKFDGAPEWLAKKITHFAAWQKRSDFQPIHLEQKVYNTEVGYAGTLDSIGTVKRSVIDELLSGRVPAAIPHKGQVPIESAREQELAQFLDNTEGIASEGVANG
jgi:hypothetical protein